MEQKEFTVRYGEDIGVKPDTPPDFLDRVFELDKKAYSDHPEYIGCIENMRDRYNAFRKSFLFLMDGDELAAYICFFPVKDELWKRIVEPEDADIVWSEQTDDNGKTVRLEQIPDDDILGKDIIPDPCPDRPILSYCVHDEENNDLPGDHKQNLRLFIISAVVDKPYRTESRAAADRLIEEWIKYLQLIKKSLNCGIESISGVVVSEGGASFTRSMGFRIKRICEDSETEEEKSRVCVCDGLCLDRLLSGQFYRKTFRDDIYIMLPFESNENNLRLRFIPPSYENLPKTACLPVHARYLMEMLKNSRDFECSNAVSREVTEHYLGSFMFLHTLDDYRDEFDFDEEPTLIGEERAEMLLLAHRRTNMYIILLMIPQSRFSTSQIFDQCSKNYIKIRHTEFKMPEHIRMSKGAYQYVHINDYLESMYGLISAGSGKCMTFMTKAPDPQPGEAQVFRNNKATTREMMNILAGETYYSLFQNFRIYNDDLMKLATEDRSVYDYYSSYMSERAVVIILQDGALSKQPPDSEFLRDFAPGLDRKDPGYLTLTRIGLATTMLFIVEMVMFQNTSLAKMTNRVSKALIQAGNVPWEYINRIYEEYGKTIRFWKTENFKYYGTECEARAIRDAFENDDLKKIYSEQQEYLQKVVDLNSAELERKNSTLIGIVGVVLAVFGAKDYIMDNVLTGFYSSLPDYWIADPAVEANRTFNVLGIGGFLLAFFLLSMRSRKNFYNKMKRLIKPEDNRK